MPTVYGYDDDNDYYSDSDVPNGHVLCPRCNGDGEVSCHCGGDLCVCDNYGDAPCPLCGGEYGGEGYVPKDKADAYLKREAEVHAAFRAAMTESR